MVVSCGSYPLSPSTASSDPPSRSRTDDGTPMVELGETRQQDNSTLTSSAKGMSQLSQDAWAAVFKKDVQNCDVCRELHVLNKHHNIVVEQLKCTCSNSKCCCSYVKQASLVSDVVANPQPRKRG